MKKPVKLTVGVTVNLEHYENLRVEVEGETADDADAAELISYLGEVLNRFGKNDPGVRWQIQRYYQRVLAGATGPDAEIAPENAPETAAGGEESSKTAVAETEGSKESEPLRICSTCGVPISAVEEQLSQLCVNRSLCKKCLDVLQEDQK